MDSRVKHLWLDALRSGEYKQGKGSLRDTDDNGEHSYCCLGVLCDLYSKETGTKWTGGNFMHGRTSFPSSEVAEWAGMDANERCGEFGDIYTEDYADLTAMNDAGGSTFAEIADVIERLG